MSRPRFTPTILLLVICALFVAARPAAAATYYVATTGSDSNPGTINSPWLSISVGVSHLVAGDTLYIRGGTYSNSVTSRIWAEDMTSSGGTSWTNAITIAGYPGERPIINSNTQIGKFPANVTRSYVIIDNVTIDGANYTTGTPDQLISLEHNHHHIRFQNSTFKNSPADMFNGSCDYCELLNSLIDTTHWNPAFPNNNNYGHGWYGAGSYQILDGNEFRNIGSAAIRFFDSNLTHVVTGCIARNNRIHGYAREGVLEGAGIILGGTNLLAYNNLIYDNTNLAPAFQVQYGGSNSGNQIYNNTVYGVYQGIMIQPGSSSTPTGTLVKNNIFYNCNQDIADAGIGTILQTNWTTSNGDPKFVNIAARDFHLQAGSGAIDAGTTRPEVPVDIVGVPRPQGRAYDIGAFEYRSGLLPPTGLRVLQ